MAEIEVESRTDPVKQDIEIAVAVGKSQSGSYALKWALENEVSPGGTVHLLHVQAPLRYIPTPLGSKLPVEQISEGIVKTFKMQRFRDAETLLNLYRKMCEKRQVKPEVHYFENDIVQNELVDQISNLKIAKLVLGTSSQSRIKKAIRGSGISSFVAKHSPDFCTVLVIYKGKLSSAKDAIKSISSCTLQCRSSSASTFDSTESSCSAYEGFWDAPTQQSLTGDGSFDLTDANEIFANQNEDHISKPHINKIAFNDPPTLVPSSNDSHLPAKNYFPPASAPKITHSKNSQSSIEYPSFRSILSNDHFGSQASQNCSQSLRTSVPMHEHTEETAAHKSPGSYQAEAYVSDTDSIFSNSIKSVSSLEITSGDYTDARSEIGLEMKHSSSTCISEEPYLQRYPLALTSVSAKSKDTTEEVEELRHQLEEARLSADQAQREALIEAKCRKQAEDFIANAMKMVAESDAQRKQDIRIRDEALKTAQVARQQTLREARRCEEAAADEKRKHLETMAALEQSKITEEAAVREAAAATGRYQEAVASLEELKKMLELEVRLREAAEEKVLQESIAKEETLAAIRQAQKRYTEYDYEELQAATNNFQEELKLGEGGYGSVYKGKIHHTQVAIKVLKRDGLEGRKEFQKEVEVLSRIHHPHMLMLLGACPLKGCIVYEYMANGSLEDRLKCKGGTPPLPWYIRFRICSEVATALLFLHSRPQPIVHRDLKPGNILLDHNFVSKIGDVGLAQLVPNNVTFSITMYKETVPVGTFAYIDPDYQRTGIVSHHSDVYALGIVMLQLLTGKSAVGVTDLVEEAVDNGRLNELLDISAGDWPLEAATELACLSLQCTEPRRKHRPDLETKVISVLENIRNLADDAAARAAAVNRPSFHDGEPIIPSFFLCPISQDIMQDPHIAADGFTYEHDVIKAWLWEHDTSPMTNLTLTHKNLIRNFSLRSAIREWREQMQNSVQCPKNRSL